MQRVFICLVIRPPSLFCRDARGVVGRMHVLHPVCTLPTTPRAPYFPALYRRLGTRQVLL